MLEDRDTYYAGEDGEQYFPISQRNYEYYDVPIQDQQVSVPYVRGYVPPSNEPLRPDEPYDPSYNYGYWTAPPGTGKGAGSVAGNVPTLRSARALSGSGLSSADTAFRYPRATTRLPAPLPQPELPVMLPPPAAPTYDEQRVHVLGQQVAAPGIRALRNKLNQVANQSFQNPNVKRVTLRDALSGYGQGLESVMAGAQRQGQAMYQSEYDAQAKNLQQQAQHTSQINQSRLTHYQNLWNQYLQSMR
jgi:hypothetical protein